MINKQLITKLTNQPARLLIVGLTLFVLGFGAYSLVNGTLFQRGPATVVAQTGDEGGNNNQQSCCDNNSSGSNDVNNDQNSDNGSNQNNSNDNPDNTYYPQPTATPAPTAAPTATPAPTPTPPSVSLNIVTNMCVNRAGSDDTQITLKFGSSRNDVMNYGVYRDGAYFGSTTGNNPYFDLFLSPGETHSFTATVQVPEGTFGHSNAVSVTGLNCSTPIPSPSPSPAPSKSPTPSAKPSYAPSPKPSAGPGTVQCPMGKVSKVVNSTIICVSQNQTQNQAQVQNNNQNQTVNQNVVATGGNSSSASSSSNNVAVTINNQSTSTTTTNREIVRGVTVLANNPATKGGAITATPQVVMQTKGEVRELPKTGLPLAALALGGLMPAGFGLKRFGKKAKEETSANSIWTERQLNN